MMSNTQFNTDNKFKYENSIKSFVDKVDAQINFLLKKIENTQEDEKRKFKSKIEALKIKRNEFMNKVNYIKQTEESKWDDTLREIDENLNSLSEEIESSYENIKNEFEKVVDNAKI